MKPNLSLIQPLEYNKIFSSYHNKTKLKKLKNYKLPKLSRLFPSQDNKDNTNSFFNACNNTELEKPNIIKYFNKNKKNEVYPVLNTSSGYETFSKLNIGSISSTMYHSYKLNNDKAYKTKYDKKENSQRLHMVYLDLIKFPSEKNKNNNIINLDSFYSNLDNFDFKDNNNKEIISKKMNEINNESVTKMINIFTQTDFGRLNDEFMDIKKMPKSTIDEHIEKILNQHRLKKNKNKIINDINSVNGERAVLVSKNIFLDWILDNLKHKVELISEYNDVLSTVWVKNLVYNEINELENKFAEFRSALKLSNFVENLYSQKDKKILRRKSLGVNNQSNFTSSTFKSHFDNSNIKNNSNSSNFNSNYFNYDNDKKNKLNIKNNVKNNMTMGFDFFINNNKPKEIKKYIDKQIISINTPYITQNNFVSNLNNYKSSFFPTKNKNELNNNEDKSTNRLWFKNVFINNPRNHKVRNFGIKYEIPTPPHINSINGKFPIKKNNDIDEIIKDSIHSIHNTISNLYTARNCHKRKTINFTYTNNYLNFKSKYRNIENKKGNLTPSKSVVMENEKDIGTKPKFQNVIIKNIVDDEFSKNIDKKFFEEDNIYNNYINNNEKDDFHNENNIIYNDYKNNNNNYKRDDNEYNNKDYGYEDNNYNTKNKNDSNYNNIIKENRIKDKIEKLDLNNNIKEKKIKDNIQHDTRTREIKNEENIKFPRKKSMIKEKNTSNIKNLKENNYNNKVSNNVKNKSENNNKKENQNKNNSRTNNTKINNNSNKNKSKINNLNQINISKITNINPKNEIKIRNKNKDLINYSSSFSSSYSKEEEGNKLDTYREIVKNEMAQNIKEGLVVKKQKNLKPRISLLKKATMTKIKDNDNILHKEEENTDLSIYSIPSIDEKEDLNENKEIKKETEFLKNILSEDECSNLLNLILILKKYLRKRNKTEKDIKDLHTNRKDIKNLICKYFRILLEKLAIKEIKEEKIHFLIYQDLQILTKFGIYTPRELFDLENEVLENRKEDVENFKNNKGNSIESQIRKGLRRLNTVQEKRIKISGEKLNLKKRNTLIYNNLYLLDEKDESDDDSNIIIKKEIQDILNTDYGNVQTNIPETEAFLVKRRKIEDEKKVYEKKQIDRLLLELKDEKLDEDMLNTARKRGEEIEAQLEKESKIEEIKEKRLYEFFSKIQKLKNKMSSNNDDELNKFIDNQIELNSDIQKEKNRARLNYFIQDFHYNRIKAKYAFNIINKKIGYISPIIFTSPNDNCFMTQNK